MNTNPMLCTDVYKFGHMSFYPPGTTKVYSYLLARSDKKMPSTLFYGLQYYLKMLETKPTQAMMDEFLDYRKVSRSGLPGPSFRRRSAVVRADVSTMSDACSNLLQ